MSGCKITVVSQKDCTVLQHEKIGSAEKEGHEKNAESVESVRGDGVPKHPKSGRRGGVAGLLLRGQTGPRTSLTKRRGRAVDLERA